MEKEVVAALIQGGGAVVGALIVGVAGGLITRGLSLERDRQDKESQWRQHAIDITKLDLERKLNAAPPGSGSKPLRPSILDFLANYRDLHELGTYSPKELYLKIEADRIKVTDRRAKQAKSVPNTLKSGSRRERPAERRPGKKSGRK